MELDLSPGTWKNLQALAQRHAQLLDAALVVALALSSAAWALHNSLEVDAYVLQAALVVPLLWRRRFPTMTLCLMAGVAFIQWLVAVPLAADVALLVGLYTVGRHGTKADMAFGAGMLEIGAVMAALRWVPAHNAFESFVLLSGLVAAAVLAGVAMRAGAASLGAVMERTARLEQERDNQTRWAAVAERTRIAREMHDIVTHSLSLMVTLADGAARVAPNDAARAAEAMGEVSAAGRQALGDMRRTLGVLRDPSAGGGFAPTPGMGQLAALVERVRATGLAVDLEVSGSSADLGATGELTVFRVVQEALTNTVKHARATRADVRVAIGRSVTRVVVTDDGCGGPPGVAPLGHGIKGMAERVSLFCGRLHAGPLSQGGWRVVAVLATAGAVEQA